MDTLTTVQDFLENPDVLGEQPILNEEQLELLGELAPGVDPFMYLADLVEIVLTASGR